MEEAAASLEQARAAFERSQLLFEKHIIPSQKLEVDKAGFLTARARLEQVKEAVTAARTDIRRAEQVVAEAQISLEYTKILAPETGIVVQRLVDPGDQAIPGRALLKIQTSGFLQLEAHVREGVIQHIVRDKEYDVNIQTVDKPCRLLSGKSLPMPTRTPGRFWSRPACRKIRTSIPACSDD